MPMKCVYLYFTEIKLQLVLNQWMMIMSITIYLLQSLVLSEEQLMIHRVGYLR